MPWPFPKRITAFPAFALLSATLLILLLPHSTRAACLGAVADMNSPLQPHRAGYQLAQGVMPPGGRQGAPLPANQLRISFIGHATFLIETPGGARAATDYNDMLRPNIVPDVATMNHAHGTHYTDIPDPGIRFVLRGWPYEGKPARHNLTVKDLRVRNIPTNIRNWGGGTEYDGNSIFVFDAADLCVAHLGHLHHTLTPGHMADLGRVDVLMVPVDGGFTLNQDQMREVVQQVQAPLVLPMHYFSESTLERFLSPMRATHTIALNEGGSILVSRETLPKKPTILILPGPH